MLQQKEKIDYYQLSVEECLEKLNSNPDWLSEEEIQSRLKIYGKNQLQDLHKVPAIFKFFAQFKDALIILLIVSALISVYLEDYKWAIVVWFIVLVNAIVWYLQEAKAEKIMQSLKKMLNPTIKVKRDWKVLEDKAEELVPGDIVYIEEGDNVPADLRVIEEMNLQANDFSLTGESNPVNKFTHEIWWYSNIGDRSNLLFMWTTVATWHWFGLVVATWMNTELGRIANLSYEAGQWEATPLQKEIWNVTKKLTISIVFLCGILLIIALIAKFTLQEALVFAVGIAMCMVPQGLPAQVSAALSLAAGRLAKNNALVKQLSSVETLGCVNIICTDKTGTLTKNEMTVKNISVWWHIYEIAWSWYEPKWGIILPEEKWINPSKQISLFKDTWKHFLYSCFLNCNARVGQPDDEHSLRYSVWDPTETALIVLAQKLWYDTDKLRDQYSEIKEFGFDSVRKMMSSLRTIEWKEFAYVKWSAVQVLDKCTRIFDGKTIKKLNKTQKDKILSDVDMMASKAMRNLALAYKPITEWKHKSIQEVESDLIFLGFASIIDPPREEVNDAIVAAHNAKIKIAMITWDSAMTAKAVWEKIWLVKPDKSLSIVTWDELKNKTDIQIIKIFENDCIIFCRTSPEDKLRIVWLLRDNLNVVAVTWDGINDAPALKKANIWVSMGKIGTDVAKDASEIVLLDDSFHTLVGAIKEWRIIFQNLKKTILLNVNANGWELFTVLPSLVAMALWRIPMALNPLQILAIDLIGEMWPLAALTWDPGQERLMNEAPRDVKQHILDKHVIIDLIWSSALMWLLWYAAYLLYFTLHGISAFGVDTWTIAYMTANSVTYTTVMMWQFANILSRRAWWIESVFSRYIWSNKKLLIAFSFSIVCVMLLIYNPIISWYFSFWAMQLIDWILPISWGIIFLLVREFHKFWRRKNNK